jgi:hypothetical protein
MAHVGYVYKIVCNETQKVYYGSTMQKLCRRIANHKVKYNQLICGKNVRKLTSFEVLKNNNYEYYIIEKLNHDDKEQLKINIKLAERKYIEKNECVNKNYPIIYDDEKEYYKQGYYYSNYENIQKQKAEKILCECCNVYIRRDNISHHNKSITHQINKDGEVLE